MKVLSNPVLGKLLREASVAKSFTDDFGHTHFGYVLSKRPQGARSLSLVVRWEPDFTDKGAQANPLRRIVRQLDGLKICEEALRPHFEVRRVEGPALQISRRASADLSIEA